MVGEVNRTEHNIPFFAGKISRYAGNPAKKREKHDSSTMHGGGARRSRRFLLKRGAEFKRRERSDHTRSPAQKSRQSGCTGKKPGRTVRPKPGKFPYGHAYGDGLQDSLHSCRTGGPKRRGSLLGLTAAKTQFSLDTAGVLL